MALLTVDQIRQHVETDLVDDALTRLVDDADAEIIACEGVLAEHTDHQHGCQYKADLWLSRRASEITEVIEEASESETTLAADDYALRPGGLRLSRRSDGTNPRTTWAPIVSVTFTPVSDVERRTRVLIDLVRLAVQFNALRSESAGDYSATSADYEEERRRILSRLGGGLSFA